MSWVPRIARLGCLAALFGSSLAAAAGTLDLAQCAAIAAADARLACYDALAGRAPAGAAQARTVLVPPPTAAAATPANAAAGSSAPLVAAPSAAAAADPQNFGLTKAELHQAPAGPASVEAQVAAVSVDASGHAYVVLENGQTWVFTEADTDSRLRPGDTVSIRRASLGSFLMVTPSRHSYHAHRTR